MSSAFELFPLSSVTGFSCYVFINVFPSEFFYRLCIHSLFAQPLPLTNNTTKLDSEMNRVSRNSYIKFFALKRTLYFANSNLNKTKLQLHRNQENFFARFNLVFS